MLLVKYASLSVLVYSRLAAINYGALSSCLYRLFLLSITFLFLGQYVKLLTVHRNPDLQFLMLKQVVNTFPNFRAHRGNFFANTRDLFSLFSALPHSMVSHC